MDKDLLLTDMRNKLKDLNGQVTDKDDQLKALNDKVLNLNTQVMKLNNGLMTKNNEVKDLNTQVTNLSNKLNEHKDKIKVEVRSEVVKEEVEKQYQTELKLKDAQHDDALYKYDIVLDAMTHKNNELKDKDDQLKALETQVTELKTQLAAKDNKADALVETTDLTNNAILQTDLTNNANASVDTTDLTNKYKYKRRDSQIIFLTIHIVKIKNFC